ncbi:helix-turn-helix domain-containing protein [Patulibacter defluvii]|uniref:helix-turn-helix domain-containing protein n=1 Tax=Patulibacter defluvii TaxID=3095358 RepID=UPI002A75FE23|nr:helix-turn-helix domain-containing protein [Patulibacter sp. DM4]
MANEPEQMHAAWERFQRGERPALPVRPVILASWTRSRAARVPPELRAAELAGRRDRGTRGQQLIAVHGTAVARRLADDLRGARCVVVLADATGAVLLRAGDRKLTVRTDRANMVPGAVWSEDAAGTNGLALALATGAVAVVLDAEHFCAGWHGYGCSSAPIRHPATRELLGALDITTPSRVHQAPAVAALVARAAREVEAAVRAGLLAEDRSGGARLHDLERQAILRALDAAGGDPTAAAAALGISRATVYRRLRAYRALAQL